MQLTSPALVSPGRRDAQPQRIYKSKDTQSPGLTETTSKSPLFQANFHCSARE